MEIAHNMFSTFAHDVVHTCIQHVEFHISTFGLIE